MGCSQDSRFFSTFVSESQNTRARHLCPREQTKRFGSGNNATQNRFIDVS